MAADPYPVYARLRAEDPILPHQELGLTLFSRYADVLSLLRDPRVGRAPLGEQTPLPRAQIPHYRRYVSRNLLEREGQPHARLRCLFAQLLTPQRITSMRAGIASRCSDLVDAAAAKSSFDLLADVAVPLTVHAIADLMGWPESDRDRLRPWSAKIVRLYERNATINDERAADAATNEFAEAIADLVERRRDRPRDDLISALARFERDGELSRDELVSSCMLLLNAGHEATVNAAGNGVLALLRHRAEWQRLQRASAGDRSRFDPLCASTIEEILRYDPPLHLFHRFVARPLEIRGVALKRGDKIGLLYGSANRDPAAFEAADRFDIRRRPNRHLAFGAETHFCMGASLARLELGLLLRTLLRRMPEMRLAQDPVAYRGGFVFRGLKSLPLSAQ